MSRLRSASWIGLGLLVGGTTAQAQWLPQIPGLPRLPWPTRQALPPSQPVPATPRQPSAQPSVQPSQPAPPSPTPPAPGQQTAPAATPIAILEQVITTVGQGVLHATGGAPESPEQLARVPYADPPARGVMPPRIDLSPSFPRPGDQGRLGTCVGWALGYLQTFHENEERGITPRESGPAYSPLFVYHYARSPGDRDCQGGLSTTKALEVLQQRGVAPIELMPYAEDRCNAVPSAEAISAAPRFRIERFERIHEHNLDEIKTHLAARHPVVISALVDDSFQHLREDTYTTRLGTNTGHHAMVVVGYDNERQAFRVLNSWGQAWADGGQVWVPFSMWPQLVQHAFVAEDHTEATPTPTPNVPGPENEAPPENPTPPPPTPEPTPDPAERTWTGATTWNSDGPRMRQYVTRFGAGMTPTFFDAWWDGQTVRFNTIWVRSTNRFASWNDTHQSFPETSRRIEAQGFQLEHMNFTSTPNGVRIHATWVRNGHPTTWSLNYQRESFETLLQERRARGLVPDQLVATTEGDRHYFHTVWRARRGSADGNASWFDRATTLRDSAAGWRGNGWHLSQLVPLEWNGNVYFHTVWHGGRAETSWSILDSAASMSATSRSFQEAGWEPQTIEVTGRGASARFHVLWRPARRGCGWRWGDTQSTLRENFVSNSAAGRQLTWMRSYPADGNERRFVSIFCREP